MPNLTTKELAGLSDQLDFERVLYSKYQTAVQETTDQELKTCFQNLAGQHQQNWPAPAELHLPAEVSALRRTRA